MGNSTDAGYLIDEPGLIAVPTWNMSRQKWLELRRGGIGGSDIAAIMGKSPWATARDVYRDKASLRAEKKPTAAMQRGQEKEPVIRGMTEEKLNSIFSAGPQFRVLSSPFLYRSAEREILIADIDGVVLVGREQELWAGLEIKAVGFYATKAWRDGGMPHHYLLQVNWYMGITRMRRWLVAPLLGNQLEIRVLEFNEELWNDQQQAAIGFWNAYLLPRICPPSIPRKKPAAWVRRGNGYSSRGKLVESYAGGCESKEVW